MSTTTVTLVPATQNGVPSGNYDGSSEEFIGDPQKAANYYRGRGGVQTIKWDFEGVQGEVTIQATLDADPATIQWFDIASFGDGSTADSATITTLHYESVLGNFTWLRAVVTNFQDGLIHSVTATY
jgi:hypothetical protein